MQHFRVKAAPFPARRHMVLATVIALALVGCESTDAKREDIVKCSGFIRGLMASGASVSSAMEAALAKDGITPKDTYPLAAAPQKYATKMDAAKVVRLAQEGSSAAMGFIRENDANGIADYLKACVATYKELGS